MKPHIAVFRMRDGSRRWGVYRMETEGYNGRGEKVKLPKPRRGYGPIAHTSDPADLRGLARLVIEEGACRVG